VAKLAAAKGATSRPSTSRSWTRPLLDALDQGVIVEYPVGQIKEFQGVAAEIFQDKWGPKISMQVIGIGYNPERSRRRRPPGTTLWNPKYKGRVGLTALNSQLGIAFWSSSTGSRAAPTTIRAGLQGTTRNCCPMSAPSPPISAPTRRCGSRSRSTSRRYNFNFVQTLKSKGVPVELSIPLKPARSAGDTSLHLVANAAEPDLAVAYIDGISTRHSDRMAKPPYDAFRPMQGGAAEAAITNRAKSEADLAKAARHRLAKINRSAAR
jgi:putative spermidine/putrescine transport system substrate-binding protein